MLNCALRFTYAISFAALISTAFQEVQYWDIAKGVDGGILFIVVPIVLGFLNCFGVEVGIIYLSPD